MADKRGRRRPGATGGGKGTNQYQIQGSSVATAERTAIENAQRFAHAGAATPSVDGSSSGALFGPGDVIHSYSRAQALADGELVDVSALAREYGFQFPVALTRAAHGTAVSWDEAHGGHQDETGRAWDVLTMTRWAISRAEKGQGTVRFSVTRLPNVAGAEELEDVDLVAVCGPGDRMEPVITIMLPGED